MRSTAPIDRILLIIVLTLLVCGFFVFSSASLGLLARTGASFSSIAFSQIFFGIIGGLTALFFTSRIHYRFWRKYAFYIFLFTLFLTLLVFVPGIGFEHGGATRWISIGGFTIQPAEFLKIGFVIYFATWFSGIYKNIKSFRYGTLPFVGFLGLVGFIMLLQPDTDTYLIMVTAALAMFFAVGGRWRDILLMGLAGILVIALLAFTRPYVMDRITTFMNPAADPQGSGYQIQQSLIAVGSGGLTGRGYGQSIQKFEYLPEPVGDSIFAVYAEEFGFLGSMMLVLLFSFFGFRGYTIASNARDIFGMLLVIGFVTIIIAQAFLNMAAMLSIAPLSGLPLPFVSHGGTALLATLAAVGIILNVSRYSKQKKA